MNKFFQAIVIHRGEKRARALLQKAMAPELAQEEILGQILSAHSQTEYGLKNQFHSCRKPAEFKERIPRQDYESLRSYVERTANGESNILAPGLPFMFNLTSGTTSKPKMIPVTAKFDRVGASLMQGWLARSILDHKGMFSGQSLGITSPETEGYTPSGIPFGSTSGRIYKRIPFFLRSTYAVPYWVSEIQDYDERYYAIARLSLELNVTFVTSPNPSTLLRLSNVISSRTPELIRDIHDGSLSISDKLVQGNFRRSKNMKRAKELEYFWNASGMLKPRDAWPHMALIGCWLGGTVGSLSTKVRADYGEHVPLRDLGYLASEGRFTLPIEDNTAFGFPDIENNFFEFVPVDEIENTGGKTLSIHELEEGKSYYLFVTNWSGLYRYDMNDIVEAGPKIGSTPTLRFLRKGRDMGNITGEKLHANQCIEAMQSLGLDTVFFRFWPDQENSCYHVFIEDEDGRFDPRAIDAALTKMNIEYEAKRKSGRLKDIRLHRMRNGWPEAEKRAALLNGQREVQYKWKIIGEALSPQFEIGLNQVLKK